MKKLSNKSFHKSLLFFLLSVPADTAWTQNSMARAPIRGTVRDASTDQPLESATVSVSGSDKVSAFSDQNGNFILPPSAEGMCLTVTYVGYKRATFCLKGESHLIVPLVREDTNLSGIILKNTSVKSSQVAGLDLALKPVKSTQELLKLIPGLFIAQHAGGGKAEQIFLRGFDCDHGTDISIHVDGLPVNMVSHVHGQGYADTHFIIPETISKIDYGTGPYNVQEGNLNTAGYVNFSTYARVLQNVLQLERGDFNTNRGLTIINLLQKSKPNQNAYVAGELYYTDGPTENKQHFSRVNLFGKYNLDIFEAVRLTVSLSAFDSKWDASGQIPSRALQEGYVQRFGSLDPSEGGYTQRYNANLTLTRVYPNGIHWESQLYGTKYRFNLYSDFTYFLKDSVHGDEIQQSERRKLYGASTKVTTRTRLWHWTLIHVYAAGVRYDQVTNSELAHVEKRNFLQDLRFGDIRESNLFAYNEQQLTAGKFTVDAGVRADHLHFGYHDKLTTQQLPAQGKSMLSPKFSLHYTPSSAVQFYLKAGKGFHSNDTRVVVANGGNQILPGAYGADLGAFIKPRPEVMINVALWYMSLNQEFVYSGDEGTTVPAGKTIRKGIDVVARYQLGKHLFANANLNLTQARTAGSPKGKDYIPLAPVSTSAGGLYYKAAYGISGSLCYRYMKDRAANEDGSILAKGYFLLDAALHYNRRRYALGLIVENLTNTSWNEAQFCTQSRLKNEIQPVTELSFTPGAPFGLRCKIAFFF